MLKPRIPSIPSISSNNLLEDGIPMTEKVSIPDSEEKLPDLDVNCFVYKLLNRNAFDDKDFSTLIRFLSCREIPQSYPLYNGQCEEKRKIQALVKDAEKLFPSFLEFLRRKYFSVNEPISKDTMRVLGKVPLENGTGEDIVELVRTRPRVFLEFVRGAYLVKGIPIPANIQQLVEEVLPTGNSNNRDESVLESEERNEGLKRYRNEEWIRLKTNPIVQRGILDYVKTQNETVMSSRCSDQYNALAFNLFLLWADIDFSLMKSVYSGQFDEIQALLADSSSKIDILVQWSKSVKEQYEGIWDTPENLIYQLQRHVQICETLNKLALIHAVNFEERQVSLVLGNLIRENIDELLKNLKPLLWNYPDLEDYYHQLDNIAGKVQWNFARGRRISGSSVEEIQKQGWEILQELQEAFECRRKARFWCALDEDPAERGERARMILKGETAVIHLIMSELISNLPDRKTQPVSQERSWPIQDLVDVYRYATGVQILGKDILISHFINGGAENARNDFPIEVVYNIVLFDDSIPENTLADLVRFFLEQFTEPKSSSYEEYAIKIIAQTMRRLCTCGDHGSSIPLANDVRTMLESQDVSRHVLNYSKLYLALALYYAESQNPEHIECAKDCFAHYKSLSMHIESDEKVRRYEKDEKWFYAAIGYSMFPTDPSGLQLSSLSDHQYYPSFVELGKSTVVKDMEDRRNAAVSGIAKTSSDMIASMTGDGDINRIGDSFWKDIGNRIAKTIFYNICTVEIRCGSHENVPKKREYETQEIRLNSDSSIVFTYPLSSEKLFNRIFSQYRDLIRQDIGNLIAIYNQNRELKIREAELEMVAFYDQHTGLPNDKKLAQDINWQERTLILIEVADYEVIVATEGGREYWEQIIKMLSIYFTEESHATVYRYDKTTFCLAYTPDIFSDRAQIFNKELEEIVYNFIDGILNQFNRTSGRDIQFHTGIAIWQQKDHIKHAHIALMESKRVRDKHLYVFKPGDEKKAEAIRRDTDRLYAALDPNCDSVKIIPYYHEIVDRDGKPVKYEALARMRQTGEEEIIGTGWFIQIATDKRLISRITKCTLPQIVANMQTIPNLNVNINISDQDWNDAGLMMILRDMAENMSDIISCTTLEILETVRVDRPEDWEKIEELRALWFCFALDDYGTSEGNHIKAIRIKPVNIKIDKDIIEALQNLKYREWAIAAIKSIVFQAKVIWEETGMPRPLVTAEYVRTKEDFELLRDLEVDLYQGFYFSEPVPFEEIQKAV